MSILKKMIRGAATAGVPMLQEEHKAQILARRDEALNKIQQQYRAEDKAFQTQMNADNQAFESGQRELDRTARANEFGATMADAAEGRAIQQEGLQLDRERLDITAQQVAQTLEAGELGIVEQRRLQGLYDTIADPEAQPEQITQAITVLNGLKGQNPEKYQAITLYGEGTDEYGNPAEVRRSGVLNQSTGQIVPAQASSASSSNNQYQTPESIREAFRSGELTREKANELLQGF